jgi:hypothetical protein
MMRFCGVMLAGLMGTMLVFWHRNLMIELRSNHPEIWQRLGGSGFFGEVWRSSLQSPFWTWKSLFFFIAKQYEKLPESNFSKKAAAFRLAFLSWVVGLLLIGAMTWHTR